MTGYSEQSQKLAQQLAEKAANNLRRSGRTVERSATTGRYIVSRKPDADITVTRGGRSGWTVTRRNG